MKEEEEEKEALTNCWRTMERAGATNHEFQH